MKPGPDLPTACASCGQDPAPGQATTYADESKTLIRLCHDETDTSCYMRWMAKVNTPQSVRQRQQGEQVNENPNQEWAEKSPGMTPMRRLDAHEQVEHNMTNHAPIHPGIVDDFESLRRLAKTFAHQIVDLCPESRERSLALTHAEEALMWAVASKARNQ
jgi:hypothetical protein